MGMGGMGMGGMGGMGMMNPMMMGMGGMGGMGMGMGGMVSSPFLYLNPELDLPTSLSFLLSVLNHLKSLPYLFLRCESPPILTLPLPPGDANQI